MLQELIDLFRSSTLNITRLGSGRKVVALAGEAEKLAGDIVAKEVVITAEDDNTGVIVVGGRNVIAALATRIGTPLDASDSVVIPCKNLQNIYIDSTVNGEGVTFSYVW